MIKVIEDNLSGWGSHATLVERTTDHARFVISSIRSAFDTGRPEMLAMRVNPDGSDGHWCLVGGRYATFEDVCMQLDAEEDLKEERWWEAALPEKDSVPEG